jgi:AcrR family transcriptional regulator
LDQEAKFERVNQKARTRAALLESATKLIREGRRPTVEEAALAAGISKRTAYRYFVSQEHLLADASLDSLRGRMDEMLASMSDSTDVHVRIAGLAVALRRLAENHDAELREMMRASLDQAVGANKTSVAPARGHRRLEWIRTSVAPVRERLSAGGYARLIDCLAVCLGVDALIVLRDICGVTGPAAEKRMIWMANAILDRALMEERESGKKRASK